MGILLYREKIEGTDAWSFQKCYFPRLQLKTNVVLYNGRQQGSLQSLAQASGAFSGCSLMSAVSMLTPGRC